MRARHASDAILYEGAISESGLDCLGAEYAPMGLRDSKTRFAVAALAGVAGALLWRRHPVLGFVGLASGIDSVRALAEGEISAASAVKRIGRYGIAVASSALLSENVDVTGAGFVGFVGGAVVGDALLWEPLKHDGA